jgi:hypothetical protein
MIVSSTEQPREPDTLRLPVFRSVITLSLLVAGWLGFFVTMEYRSRLEEGYGPRPDVYDALVCAAFVGRRTLPWFSGVVILDFSALLVATFPRQPGRLRMLQVFEILLIVPSGCIHGLSWAVTAFFAA